MRFRLRFLSLRSIRASSDLHLSLFMVYALGPRSNPRRGDGVPAQPLEGGVATRTKGSVCVRVVGVRVFVVWVVSKVQSVVVSVLVLTLILPQIALWTPPTLQILLHLLLVHTRSL
jgi:hypothetical protein